MAYGFQSIKNSRTLLVAQLSPFPAPSQPQPPTPESQDPYPAPATVPGSLQPQASCSNFGAGCCQGQALGWLRLAPGGGVRLRSSSGRLQAGWGMRGWAGKKKSIGKVKKKSKKSKVRILALADYWRQQKVKKKVKKKSKKSQKGKTSKKGKKSRKKSQKKSNVKTKRGS